MLTLLTPLATVGLSALPLCVGVCGPRAAFVCASATRTSGPRSASCVGPPAPRILDARAEGCGILDLRPRVSDLGAQASCYADSGDP
jgi:hypothetical protein